MPVCKNCNARISKFDKDRCPVCGCIDPISTEHSETVEITSNISLDNELRKNVKIRKKTTVLVLALLLPFVGTPFYYLKFPKKGLIWLACNLIFIGALFALSYYVIIKGNLPLSIIAPLIIAYIFNIWLGILLYTKKDYKDGYGELVR